MKRKPFAVLIFFLLILSLTSNVMAQEEAAYLFTLEKEEVHVFYNEEGLMSLDYLFVFENAPNGHVIDFVDVGMPNYYWDIFSVYADVDGNYAAASRDDYMGIGSGFAVVLGEYAIPPGERASVHVYVEAIYAELHQDDNDKDYASAVFGTTWFGTTYVTGTTDLTVSLHLPPGVQPDEPRYHLPQSWAGEQTPEAYIDESGNITYTWHDPNANGYTQYLFGASFPDSYVPEEAITRPITFWQRITFSLRKFFNLRTLIPLAALGSPLAFLVIDIIRTRRRRIAYLPPKIAIEGHGIKRGLTAPEAAILMELPLDTILAMILFGVIKKGAATITSRDPLEIEVTEPLPTGLHQYEENFLSSYRKNTDTLKVSSASTIAYLVQSVNHKMKGFSRTETIAYYKKIMKKAWEQVENAGTPEVKSEHYSKGIEWMMLDKKHKNRIQDIFRSEPVYVPLWWSRYDPTFKPVSANTTSAQTSLSGSKSTMPASSPPSLSMPKLPGADFAASIVIGTQNFSQKVIGNLTDFTTSVTSITNPVPVSKIRSKSGSYRSSSSRSSGRSGGGSSCACACACAGCACACAGGGR